MTTPTIHVHTDKKCWACGKKGATGKDGNGICLNCYVKFMKAHATHRTPDADCRLCKAGK